MKSSLVRYLTKGKIISALVIILLGWGAYALWFAPKSVQLELATATRGTLIQEVSVTGNTAPVTNLDLAFENGGTIAAANYDVGSHVQPGDVIARLNTSDLQAQLAQAQANVDSQAAKLRSLQAGSRPEDIQASQASVAKAKQDLANMYASVSDTLTDAFARANDAVRNQLSSFFINAETNNPQLTFTITDSQTLNYVLFKRVQATTELTNWQTELLALDPAAAPSVLDGALNKGIAHLNIVKGLFLSLSQALVSGTNLSQTSLNTYKTSMTTGATEVGTAAINVNTASQNIASQKITIEQLQAQLSLKVAGSTAEDIAAQQAQVEQAQASAQNIQVKIAKASLVSPIAGVVTRNDAKVGQIATPGAVLVSIISDQGLEVDANIAEADIGKVSVGDPAKMTLDAFSGETFSGKVSYIDPGEKVIEGVATYKTTFQFDNLGPQVKPGMTANIDITADTRENAIYVPQRAVISKDGSRYVMIYAGANQPTAERAVTVGLRDSNGNIEIVSGLNEGEVVLRSPE